MCGITGFISPGYSRENLRSITQTIQHRGPDAEGLFDHSLKHFFHWCDVEEDLESDGMSEAESEPDSNGKLAIPA